MKWKAKTRFVPIFAKYKMQQMRNKILLLLICVLFGFQPHIRAQVNTDRVMTIGRNALYYEDYILAIQYFNQVIKAKPYLADPYYLRAIAKFSLDDIKGAEEDCSACLERNPFITNAYQLRGDTRQQLENYQGARDDYARALQEMPGNKFLLINLGIVNIELKSYDEAKTNLDELIKTYPNFNAGYLTMAALKLEQKDTTTAFQYYDKAIDVDKYFAQSYSMRGMLHLQKKQYEKAYSDLDEAIKLNPMASGNYINRGLIRYYRNDLRGAMADYDKVLDMEPSSLIARFNRGLLRTQVGDDNRAIEDFNKVIEIEPENYMAYYNRAILKNSISDFRGALKDINIVMSQYPDYYQGFFFRAELKKRLGDMKGSERDYNYARSMEVVNQRKLTTAKGRNEVQKREKKREDAMDKTREKSDKDIDKFNLLVVSDKNDEQKSKYANETRGRVQDKQVRIELLPKFVISYYENQSDLNIKRFVYYNSLLDEVNKNPIFQRKLRLTNNETALTEAQIDTHFKLIDEYTKTIAAQPNNAYAYFARGMEYLMVQDFTSAAEDFKRTISLNDKFTLAYFNLAVVTSKEMGLRHSGPEYEATSSAKAPTFGTSQAPQKADPKDNSIASQDKMDYDLILNNYNRVIALAPNFSYGYYNRAEIRASLKDYKAAITDYDEVLKLDPELAEAYYNRGLCKLSIRDTESGLSDLRQAGELGIVDAYSIIKRMTGK